MRIIGLAGWRGSGKTTLLTQVIPRLVARGLKVSTLQHPHHAFDLHQPGKDAHRHRLGPHYEALPVNAPKCPVHQYHKDGAMRVFANNPNPDAYYEPNSMGGPVQDPAVKEPPLAISVEARRQRGQTFDVISGLFNQFELIYIWGSEQDVTGSRALVEKHSLYMYPLTIPADSAEALFLQLSQTSAQLDVQPRFYNSLTSNCTNELAKAANAVHPGAIPLNVGLIMPGYSDKVLYDLGFIPHDAPFQELRQRYSVADVVLADYGRPDFPSLLRGELKRRESGPA